MATRTQKESSAAEGRPRGPAFLGAFIAPAIGMLVGYTADILSLYSFGGASFVLWIAALALFLANSAYLTIRVIQRRPRAPFALLIITFVSVGITVLVSVKLVNVTTRLENIRASEQQSIPPSDGNSGTSLKDDVTGRDFGASDLDRLQAPNVLLREVNFSGSSLREADFRGATLIDVSFEGADLCGADLRGANLSESPSIREASSLKFALYDDRTRFPQTGNSDGEVAANEITLPEYSGQMIYDSGAAGMIYECDDGEIMQLTEYGRIRLGQK